MYVKSEHIFKERGEDPATNQQTNLILSDKTAHSVIYRKNFKGQKLSEENNI